MACVLSGSAGPSHAVDHQRSTNGVIAGIKAPGLLVFPEPLPDPRAPELDTGQRLSVTVKPLLGRDIGGYSEVQPVFGLMWGGNVPSNVDRSEIMELIKGLQINAARLIDNGWVTRFPWEKFGTSPAPPAGRSGEKHAAWHSHPLRFDSWRASFEWWDRWIAETDPVAYWGGSGRGWGLSRARGYADGSAGTDYELTWCANGQALLDGRCDRNKSACAMHFLAIADEFRKVLTSGIRLRFLQLSNEPNDARSYLGQFRNPEQREGAIDPGAGVDAYTRVFNTTHRLIKHELPGIRVIGSSPGWMAPFYYEGPGNAGNQSNWQMWAKRFIDGIQDPDAADYFNYHAYSVAPSTHMAYLGLTRNHSWLKHKRKPRAVITEASHFAFEIDTHPADKRRDQFLHTLQDLFMQLERPDVFDTRHQFFGYGGLGEPNGALHLITWRPDGTIVPQANYWALWALKETRGRMLVVADNSRSVRSFATLHPNGSIVVSLFNPNDHAIDATVDSGWRGGVRSVKGRYATFVESKANCDHGNDDLPAGSTVSLSLKPHSVVGLVFEPIGKVAPRRAVRWREFFGDRTELVLDQPQRLAIAVRNPDQPVGAVLRLAFQELLSTGTAHLALNGESLSFSWDEAPRSLVTYDGWLPEETSWVGIPIDPDLVRRNNTLVLEPVSGQRLFYAALELIFPPVDDLSDEPDPSDEGKQYL